MGIMEFLIMWKQVFFLCYFSNCKIFVLLLAMWCETIQKFLETAIVVQRYYWLCEPGHMQLCNLTSTLTFLNSSVRWMPPTAAMAHLAAVGVPEVSLLMTGDTYAWTHEYTNSTSLLLWKRCRGSVLWQDESWQPKSLTSRVPTSLRLALWERRGNGSSGAKNFSYRDSDMDTWHSNRGKDGTHKDGTF